VSVVRKTISALRRFIIVIAIAITFLFGLATTVILSLRSPVVTVPQVVGKDRFEAESTLRSAGLNFRVRAARPSNQVKPDTVLFQLPRAGEEVKGGQTIAVDVSRPAKEGEASEGLSTDDKAGKGNENTNANTNESSSAGNANESKPKRNKNTNNNGNANNNRNANANRARANANNRNANSETNTENQNRESDNSNSNRSNRNRNRRPSNEPTPPPGALL
jgi:beta-lactam-binding protein with PASTA domain